jgi:hypothetical protein
VESGWADLVITNAHGGFSIQPRKKDNRSRGFVLLALGLGPHSVSETTFRRWAKRPCLLTKVFARVIALAQDGIDAWTFRRGVYEAVTRPFLNGTFDQVERRCCKCSFIGRFAADAEQVTGAAW